MVGPGEVDEELEGETAEECAKHGPVSQCLIYEVCDRNYYWFGMGWKGLPEGRCLFLICYAMELYFNRLKMNHILKKKECAYLSHLNDKRVLSKVSIERLIAIGRQWGNTSFRCLFPFVLLFPLQLMLRWMADSLQEDRSKLVFLMKTDLSVKIWHQSQENDMDKSRQNLICTINWW